MSAGAHILTDTQVLRTIIEDEIRRQHPDCERYSGLILLPANTALACEDIAHAILTKARLQ